MKQIDVTALILGICPPQRLRWLKKSIDHLDKQNFPFVKKILAVDEFRGDKMPQKLIRYFESNDWTVLVDSHMSRMKSMDHAFSVINSTYIFYNEDDVLATMPRISDVTKIFTEINDRQRTCGMLSLTLGGSKNHFPENKYGDLDKIENNILLKMNDYLAFKRLETERNDWFFEFPALFIRSELFKLCHETAKRRFPGLQVEMGLTKAWFYEKLDRKYYKCSICKKDILQIVSNNPLETFHKSRLITLLDPNQGNSPFGGNHSYGVNKNLMNRLKEAQKKYIGRDIIK